MKLLLTILLFCSLNSFARQVYVSATGSDAAAGTSAGTAWQTLSKVNSSIIAGDTVNFNKGDVFFGTLSPTVANLTFRAYGSGVNPIITGLITISSWTNLGGNIWEATVTGGPTRLNTVIIGGKLIAMGRFPNQSAANEGHLTYTTFIDHSRVTNAALAGTDFTGGEVIVREQSYATDRATITSQADTIINYTSSATVSMRAGFGFFVQNHPTTLDLQNEWYYYDASGTKKIKVYSTSNPGSIQVATRDSLLNLNYGSSKTGYSFTDIDFKGANGTIVKMNNANTVTFSGCNFSFSGISAIEYAQAKSFTISGCSISDANMCGIFEVNKYAVDSLIFTNTSIKRINVNAGMLAPPSALYPEGNSGAGIVLGSKNVNVSLNVFDSIGYNCISLRPKKKNVLVEKNLMEHFCMVKNDGGAIYNVAIIEDYADTNIVYQNNIIANSVGAIGGTGSTFPHVRAVYLDANSNNIQVLNNTIIGCNEGVYFSQAINNVVRGNMIYSGGMNVTNWAGMLSMNNANVGYQKPKNNLVTKNVLYAALSTDVFYNVYDGNLGVDSIGIMDSNYYFNAATVSSKLFNLSGTVNNQKTYAQWIAAHTMYEANTVYSTSGGTLHYNATASASVVNFSGYSKKDQKGDAYSHSYTLAPFTSVILFNNGTIDIPPVANAGVNQSITLPIDYVTLSSTGTTGTIVAYAWSKISGTGGTILMPSGATTVVSGLTAGVYIFRLTVTDANTLTDTDDVQITVNPAVVPPTPGVSYKIYGWKFVGNP